jgi:hypothetical protein
MLSGDLADEFLDGAESATVVSIQEGTDMDSDLPAQTTNDEISHQPSGTLPGSNQSSASFASADAPTNSVIPDASAPGESAAHNTSVPASANAPANQTNNQVPNRPPDNEANSLHTNVPSGNNQTASQPQSSSDSIAVSIGTVSAEPGATNVQIPITVTNNPGIADAMLLFEIPHELTLVSFDSAGGMIIDIPNPDGGAVLLTDWDFTNGYTGELLVTLIVNVSNTATTGTKVISVVESRSEFVNPMAVTINSTYSAGGVTVI